MKSTKLSKDIKLILNDFGINSIVSEDMDYIDVQDEGTISYTPISKLSRIEQQGADPWKTNRVSMKVGKFLNKTFILDGPKLENVVNQFKTAFYTSKGEYDKIFSIVQGEDIRFWYNEKNYVQGGGSLNGSCMKGEVSQLRLDLYTENPNVVKLLIMKEGDKLLGRALLWTFGNQHYIDRPYVRYDKDQWLYRKYAYHMKYYNYYNRGYTGGILTTKTRKAYTQLPYLDSVRYADKTLSLSI
jgi:hypothetical protein